MANKGNYHHSNKYSYRNLLINKSYEYPHQEGKILASHHYSIHVQNCLVLVSFSPSFLNVLNENCVGMVVILICNINRIFV